MGRKMEAIITTENPEVHWGFANVKDRVVLDLGCGKVWNTDRIRSSDGHLHWPDTPEFFLKRGAKKVIGIDSRSYEIERYQDEYLYTEENSRFEIGMVKTGSFIEWYLDKYKPNCVKCDIEHHERVLQDVSDEKFSSVDEWYVECHTDELFEIVTRKLNQNGYSIFFCGRLLHSSPEARVLGAWK
jgi:hypothetical protein